MAFYAFPTNGNDSFATGQAVAFCKANDINPKAPTFGSTFEVTGDDWVLTHEFVLVEGRSRVLHEGCCGSGHFAKTRGKYKLAVRPEEFGFTALLDASGNVAP